jgi:hypothetical protein
MISLLLLACSKPTAPAAQPPAPAPVAEPARTVDWTGTWTSASCGDREYERAVVLAAEQRATVEERISPCPPDAQCMWSGVVVFEGSWKADGDTLTLALGEPLGAPQGGETPTPPTSLTHRDGALHADGCAYTR